MKTTLSILIGIFTVLVTQAQENSGRNSHFWLTLKPLAGTVAASDSDLVLDNGYRKLDLSSSELSCTRVDGPNGGWAYQIRWSGNRLVGNHNPDPVTFNVYVDGYSGSQFVYTANNNNGTVSSLGSLSTPSDLNNGWGVGNDVEKPMGETITT